jgi:hypothetical protein
MAGSIAAIWRACSSTKGRCPIRRRTDRNDQEKTPLTEQAARHRPLEQPPYLDYQRDEDHDGEGGGSALLKPPHSVSSRLAHAFHASQLY